MVVGWCIECIAMLWLLQQHASGFQLLGSPNLSQNEWINLQTIWVVSVSPALFEGSSQFRTRQKFVRTDAKAFSGIHKISPTWTWHKPSRRSNVTCLSHLSTKRPVTLVNCAIQSYPWEFIHGKRSLESQAPSRPAGRSGTLGWKTGTCHGDPASSIIDVRFEASLVISLYFTDTLDVLSVSVLLVIRCYIQYIYSV